VTDCYYRRLPADGQEPPASWGLFESTDGTRSNWDPDIQHGSPPLALLTKAIEELAGATSGHPTLRIARLGLDILGAIPVAPVRVHAWVSRPGSRIAMMTAEMSAASRLDRAVARVTAWLMAPSDTHDVTVDRYPPLVEGEPDPVQHDWVGAPGYLQTVSWRRQTAADGDAAVVWLSPLVALVDDEPTTPIQRLAMVVDCANGAGATLDPGRFLFMNTDTVVHLHRVPTGSDFALRARASIGPDGIGETSAEIFDRQGFIGTSAQALLVQRR